MSPCSMKLWTSQIRSISFRTELSEEIMIMVSRNLLCLTPFLIRQDKDQEALNERLELAKTKLESCPLVSNLWQWLPGIGDNYPGTEYNIVQSLIAYDSELLKWLVSSPHPLVIGSPWQWDIIPQLQMIQPFKSQIVYFVCQLLSTVYVSWRVCPDAGPSQSPGLQTWSAQCRTLQTLVLVTHPHCQCRNYKACCEQTGLPFYIAWFVSVGTTKVEGDRTSRRSAAENLMFWKNPPFCFHRCMTVNQYQQTS